MFFVIGSTASITSVTIDIISQLSTETSSSQTGKKKTNPYHC